MLKAGEMHYVDFDTIKPHFWRVFFEFYLFFSIANQQ